MASPSHSDTNPEDSPPPNPLQLILNRASGRVRTFSEGPGGSDGNEYLTGGPDSDAIPVPGEVNFALDFVACGRALKRHCTLSARAEEDFDAFINASGPGEHVLRSYLAVLECRDLLVSIRAGTAYTMSEDVKDAITRYSHVFILSPGLVHYKKRTGPTTVLAAMRNVGVSALPPDHDAGCVEVILKAITKALTDARFQVKEQISDSLKRFKDGSGGCDIASLVYECVGGKTKPTVGVFMRIAFLRWVMDTYPDKNAGKYWDEVDSQLTAVRKDAKSAEEREAAFKVFYQDDVEKYGKPNTDCPTVSADRVDNWIKTVNRFASNSANAALG